MLLKTKIINWYHKNKRELPWRQEVNPYHIWLSEVILQQTRVEQGLPYYLKFVDHYPTVFDLARASEDEILKDWQGLGYYSRARNLHQAAKTIVTDYNGKFPETFEELIKLKGIGEYTAAAISSIAFNQPHPVIDGNVMRVISRIFGIQEPVNSKPGLKQVRDALNENFNKRQPGDFNQAIMEFGATYCTPWQPNCESCIFRSGCFAFEHNLVDKIPYKLKKVKTRSRYFIFFVIKTPKGLFFEKRGNNDIWRSLFQFPMLEVEKHPGEISFTALQEITQSDMGPLKILDVSRLYKHQLTHQLIHAIFLKVQPQRGFKPPRDWVTSINLGAEYALPVLIQNYLDDSEN